MLKKLLLILIAVAIAAGMIFCFANYAHAEGECVTLNDGTVLCKNLEFQVYKMENVAGRIIVADLYNRIEHFKYCEPRGFVYDVNGNKYETDALTIRDFPMHSRREVVLFFNDDDFKNKVDRIEIINNCVSYTNEEKAKMVDEKLKSFYE